VRIRARHEGAPAVVERRGDPAAGAAGYIVRFASPVRAVSPGQVAVAYRGDRVLGGGTIRAALPGASCPAPTAAARAAEVAP
jgi:tRNA-specific 2-thiouridylase